MAGRNALMEAIAVQNAFPARNPRRPGVLDDAPPPAQPMVVAPPAAATPQQPSGPIYDPTPDTPYTDTDHILALLENAGRNFIPGTNRMLANVQSYMAGTDDFDERLSDYNERDKAMFSDYPIQSTAANLAGAAITAPLGAGLIGGALKGGAALARAPQAGNALMRAATSLPGMAATGGALAVSDELLDRPDDGNPALAGVVGTAGGALGKAATNAYRHFRPTVESAIQRRNNEELRHAARSIAEGRNSEFFGAGRIADARNAQATIDDALSRPGISGLAAPKRLQAETVPTTPQPRVTPEPQAPPQNQLPPPQLPRQNQSDLLGGEVPAVGNQPIVQQAQQRAGQPVQELRPGNASQKTQPSPKNLTLRQKDSIKSAFYKLWEQRGQNTAGMTVQDLRDSGLVIKAGDQQIVNYVNSLLKMAEGTGQKFGKDQVAVLKKLRESGAKFALPAAVSAGAAATQDFDSLLSEYAGIVRDMDGDGDIDADDARLMGLM